MKCFVPAVPALGDCCPVVLMRRWLAKRAELWPDHADGFVFAVSSAAYPKQLSSDTFRKALSGVFPGHATGTHSMRKGGAQWYRSRGNVPEQTIQLQGGWSSPECMRSVYTTFHDNERRQLFVEVGRAHVAPCPASVAA